MSQRETCPCCAIPVEDSDRGRRIGAASCEVQPWRLHPLAPSGYDSTAFTVVAKVNNLAPATIRRLTGLLHFVFPSRPVECKHWTRGNMAAPRASLPVWSALSALLAP